jgi:hypothetical protein
MLGVFRVKIHFTPKNHIFSNFRGGGVPPPGTAPDIDDKRKNQNTGTVTKSNRLL